MEVSYIIPCLILNDSIWELTKQAINSMRNATPEAEFVIIDNNSPIGGGYLRGEANVYIRNKENLGFPKAMNQGIALAHGELLGMSNNDIRVSPNWFEVAKRIFGTYEHMYHKIITVHFRMLAYDEPFSYGSDIWIDGKERWCHGSFFALHNPKKPFYDENYGIGGYDDWDWQHRWRHIDGYKTVYTNKACFQHADSSTLQHFSNREDFQLKNKNYFHDKFGQFPEEIWNEKYPEQMKQSWKPFP